MSIVRSLAVSVRLIILVVIATLVGREVGAHATETVGKSALFLTAETRVNDNGRVVATRATVVNKGEQPVQLAIGVFCPVAFRLYKTKERDNALWDGAKKVCTRCCAS